MLAVNPDKACECDVTMLALSVVVLPYPVVVPYSTWVSDASFVVQVIVAAVLVTPELPTLLIVGGVVSGAAVVVNV